MVGDCIHSRRNEARPPRRGGPIWALRREAMAQILFLSLCIVGQMVSKSGQGLQIPRAGDPWFDEVNKALTVTGVRGTGGLGPAA